VEVSALSVLGYNVNYRDSQTGLVPTFTQLVGRSQQSNWPITANATDTMRWSASHHPAAGLMAFICRPSPVFIEIAQKIAVWNGTWSNYGPVTTGVFGRPYQIRGKAWCLRSLAHAIFLTPSTLPWRAAAQTSLAQNIQHLRAWDADPKDKLNVMWESSPTTPESTFTTVPAFTVPLWQHHYLVTEVHKIASARLLSGADQSAAEALANWAALQPVRWVNEQPNGGWRYINYGDAIGRNTSTIDMMDTWAQQRAWWMTDAPPSVSGPWMSIGSPSSKTYASAGVDGAAGAFYPSYFWAALVAAVDRNVPGALQAWNTVNSNITGLEAWRAAFASDPRWGAAPQTTAAFGVPAPSPSPAPTPAPAPAPTPAGEYWTPVRDASGIVTQASWSTVPTNRWVQVAGTRLDSMDAAVKAAIPGWRDWGVEGWSGVTDAWNGMAIDAAGSRLWLKGGGHSASGNNGIYRFDALKMAWAIEDMPSDPAAWSASYIASRNGGTFTFCNESHQTMLAKRAAGTLQAVNDVFYDELFWDGKPTSRHTYSSMVFVPETNELVMICRRLWRYSLTQRRWTYKRLIRDTPDNWMDGENMAVFHDEATREVLVSAAGSSGIYRATGYNLATNQWTNWTSPWNLYSGIADTRVGRRAVVIQPGCTAAAGYGEQPMRYWDYNLDSRSTVTSGTVQLAGGLTLANFAKANWFYDSSALAYIPPLNRFWFYTRSFAGPMMLLEVDPTTTPWTARPCTANAGNFPVPRFNMERKFIFLPALNALLLCDTASKDLYLYKF
jgi:hypothetical protein